MKVPEPISTIDKIYARYEDVAKQEPIRKHLGGSEIGHSCDRKLWYSFHHVFDHSFSGRMLRLFDTGNLEEDRVVRDLESTGAIVYSRQKKGFVLGGFFGGSIDGIVLQLFESPKTPHLFECKTHSSSSFQKLVREGVQKAKPEHFAQMQSYMGIHHLTRAVYIAKNKDNDELYMERVEFDSIEFKAVLERAKGIILGRFLPPKVSTNPNSYICRYCDVVTPCHAQHEPKVNCRTCNHSTPILDENSFQQWQCGKYDYPIPSIVEFHGCKGWEKHEAFQTLEVNLGLE